MTGWKPFVGAVVFVAGHRGLWKILWCPSPGLVLLCPAASSRHRVIKVKAAQIKPTTTTAIERRLGARQRLVLAELRALGPWPGRTPTFRSPAAMRAILRSLEGHGLVERVDLPAGPGSGNGGESWRAVKPARLQAGRRRAGRRQA